MTIAYYLICSESRPSGTHLRLGHQRPRIARADRSDVSIGIQLRVAGVVCRGRSPDFDRSFMIWWMYGKSTSDTLSPRIRTRNREVRAEILH